MTTFDERERGFEQKFAHDADLKFRAESRRNRAVGEWAGAKLGLTGAALEAYVASVRKADLSAAGDQDVLAKIKTDFAAKGLSVPDGEIRAVMDAALAKAVIELGGASS